MLEEWRRHDRGNLLVVLPDAFGTAAFLCDAPEWVADWTGLRPDSAPPIDRPTVKLSNNPAKSTGDSAAVARYLRLFGEGGRTAQRVLV